MRQYESKQRIYDDIDTEKVSAHLDETMIFTGFKTVKSNQYGEMGVISVQGEKDLTTFSGVLITQFQEEAEKGFPFKAKIVQRKRYYTLEQV